jgi:hypothetical protein
VSEIDLDASLTPTCSYLLNLPANEAACFESVLPQPEEEGEYASGELLSASIARSNIQSPENELHSSADATLLRLAVKPLEVNTTASSSTVSQPQPISFSSDESNFTISFANVKNEQAQTETVSRRKTKAKSGKKSKRTRKSKDKKPSTGNEKIYNNDPLVDIRTDLFVISPEHATSTSKNTNSSDNKSLRFLRPGELVVKEGYLSRVDEMARRKAKENTDKQFLKCKEKYFIDPVEVGRGTFLEFYFILFFYLLIFYFILFYFSLAPRILVLFSFSLYSQIGAFGIVKKARYKHGDKQEYAIKSLFLFDDSFMKEYKIMQTLNHGNIVAQYWFFITTASLSSTLHIVMELCDTDLEKCISDPTSVLLLHEVNIEQKTSWCYQLLVGIDYLHSLPTLVLHRDLKAGKID